MKSESADVLELKMGRIGKFLIFKMAAHFRARNESSDFSNGIVMFYFFFLYLFIFFPKINGFRGKNWKVENGF